VCGINQLCMVISFFARLYDSVFIENSVSQWQNLRSWEVHGCSGNKWWPSANFKLWRTKYSDTEHIHFKTQITSHICFYFLLLKKWTAWFIQGYRFKKHPAGNFQQMLALRQLSSSLPATDTQHQFLLCHVKRNTQMWMLTNGGVTCTICYPCAI
jgi:hypothetical protein